MNTQKLRKINNNKLMQIFPGMTYAEADDKRSIIKQMGISIDDFIKQNQKVEQKPQIKGLNISIILESKSKDKITGELAIAWLKAQLENSDIFSVKINEV